VLLVVGLSIMFFFKSLGFRGLRYSVESLWRISI
jgi:hypothetical protein